MKPRQTTGRFRRPKNRRTTQKPPRARWTLPSWPWLRTVCALVALIGAVIALRAGWGLVVESDRLRVASVEVLGSERIRWEELQAFTELQVGDPILSLDLDAVAAGVRRHPWVKSVTVRRRLPDRVSLLIQEHAAALLVALGEVYIADPEGVVFKRLSPRDGVRLPVLTGLDPRAPLSRPEVTRTVIIDALALGAALAVPEVEASLGSVEEIHWDEALGFSVVVLGEADATLVHLGLDPVPRIDVALAARARLRRAGHTPLEIWADGSQRSTRVHARVRTVATGLDEQGTQPQRQVDSWLTRMN